MKNYKFVAPIVLIALFVLGIYMTGSNRRKDENQYNQYLEEARRYAAQEIAVYAGENYQKALDMRPSLELYLEVAGFYQDGMADFDRAVEWGEAALKLWPREPDAYEFLLSVYLEDRDYIAFFELYHDMLGRHVESETADAFYQSVKYEYYFEGQYDEVSAFGDNLAPVRRNENWGYSNTRGKRRISTVYTYAGVFNQGMAPVIDAEGEGYFIDTGGNKVLVVDTGETIVKLGSMSAAGVYGVYNGREWNYYNKSGEMIMGGFTEAAAVANGLTACKSQSGWQIYDASGNVQTDAIYDEVLTDEKQMAYRNERFFVREGDSCKMIDASGGQIGTDTYEDAKIFYESTYAAVRKGGKWGFVDKEGNWFIEPVYEDARSFSNGYAAVQMEGQWGFINMEKELCIPCQFTDAKDFTARGTVFVQRDMVWQVLLLYQNNY